MFWLFARDVQQRRDVSVAVWMACIWTIIIGSRPVSSWFSVGVTGDVASDYDEGNPVERYIFFVLIVLGIVTLVRRRLRVGELVRRNFWLVLFFVYWGASVVWADAPFVALRRWVKDLGNVIIVLVVLTEQDPIDAIKAVFARCAYVLIPMSFLLIRYFSQYGRRYHVWSGEMMYTGVATHKNSLGALVLVCALFAVWDLLDRPKDRRRDTLMLGSQLALLTMMMWLLYSAHSATASACTFLGLALFLVMRLSFIKKHANHLGVSLIAVMVVLGVLNSMFGLYELVVTQGLGRDMTLTTRTEVWPMLLSQSTSTLFGSGFNSFWTGERLAFIWGHLGIIQAHNGYLETYLNGGLVGCTLLIAFFLGSFLNIKRDIVRGGQYASLRFSLLAITIIYNFTEATFDKVSLLWFVQLLVCVDLSQVSEAAVSSVAQTAPAPRRPIRGGDGLPQWQPAARPVASGFPRMLSSRAPRKW